MGEDAGDGEVKSEEGESAGSTERYSHGYQFTFWSSWSRPRQRN